MARRGAVLSDGVVTLRQWRRTDVPAIVAACQDEEVLRWLDRIPSPYGEAEANTWLDQLEAGRSEGSFFGLAVTDDGDDRVLGAISLTVKEAEDGVAEIGYWLAREERGRGVMTRALRLLAGWGLDDLGLERLYLRADPENRASCAVAERAGFVYEGVQRSEHYNPRLGRRVDFAIYSLLRGERERVV